jgi:GNAT superfamily N-acetyltransferase
VRRKKKQIKELWKDIFGDSDEFIRLYFKQVYQDRNALVIEKGGQVLSALQLLPYTMTFCGEEITVAYVAGVCTLPSERGKGLMRQLMQQAFDEMRKREIALTALIPAGKWLFDYYRSQGYTEAFEYSLKVYDRLEYSTPGHDWLIREQKKPDESLYAYFNRKLRERPVCILHSYDNFRIILKDMQQAGGQLIVAYDRDKQPAGMAFVFPPDLQAAASPRECSVLIKEFLCDDEQIMKQLLYEITKRFNVMKAVYRVPSANGLATYPYGMARVMDVERLTALWVKAHPENRCPVNDLRAMDIPALTSCLLNYPSRTAYMSLMMD